MTTLKYSKYIVTKPKKFPPELETRIKAEQAKRRSTVKSTRLMSVDSEIVPGFFYVDCNWLWSGSAEDTAEDPHTHGFDEVIGFVGSNREDPHDLGGEITIWLDSKKEVLHKSCLIFVPAGTPHCPILFNRIDSPIFFITISTAGEYSRTVTENKAASKARPKYTIVTETKQRFTVAASGGATPTIPRDPSLRSTRLLHLEDDMAKGSFYVDFVWLWEGKGGAPAPEHTHEWPELIAMAGCDPEHPHDLGGRMSIVLGDETHYIEKSSLVCIPKGLKHCPWLFLEIRKPILVFSAGPQGMYTGSHKKEKAW